IAQIPMAERDSPLFRTTRQARSARHERWASATAERLWAGRLLQDHELRETAARSRPDRCLGARAGHCRRGPARKKLEHACSARLETDRQPICDRFDWNAPGE